MGHKPITRDKTVALASQSDRRLAPSAAASWNDVCAEMKERYGWTPYVTSAWRDQDTEQVRIFTSRHTLGNHKGKPGYSTASYAVKTWNGQQWTLKAGMANASVPGTSPHGAGIAVDAGKDGRSFSSFTDPNRVQFLAVARAHGWTDTTGRAVSEPWHFDYEGPADKFPTTIGEKMLPLNLASANKTPVVGDAVLVLQALLTARKHYKGALDGKAGPVTRTALGAFQSAKGLKVDYLVGPVTWNRLLGIA